MSLLTTFLKLRTPLGVLVRYKQVSCKPPGGSGPKKDSPKDPCKKEIKSEKKTDCIPNPAFKKRKCGSKKEKQASPCQSKPKTSPCQPKAIKSPCETQVKPNPCQTKAKVNPCTSKPKVSPCQSKTKVSPCPSKSKASPCESKTIPNLRKTKPKLNPCQSKPKARPKVSPCQSKAKVRPCQPKAKASPCETQAKPNPCQTKPKMSVLCKTKSEPTIKKSDPCDMEAKKSKCKSSSSSGRLKQKRPLNICSSKKSKIEANPCKTKLTKSAFQGGKPDTSKALNMETINPKVIKIQYAVRGPLVIRANKLAKELKKGEKKPFPAVIRANIGDAHAMGQIPLTYFRQVMSGALFPELLKKNVFPEDVIQRVYQVLDVCSGRSVGSYTDSTGIELFRRDVARYISKRDGFDCDYNNVFLCAGASTGIKNILKLLVNKIKGKNTGILIPIPQYPLYSAALDEYGLGQCHYYLNEERNWSLDISELHRAYKEHSKKFAVRALVIINPGNPTGQLLTKENVAELLKFAAERNLFVLADEVYQHNIWSEEGRFHSFKKLLMENHSIARQVELASFMSISKGYFGECGLRGGWCELTNMDKDVQAQLYKACSANLCSSSIGQIAVSCVARPPKQGDPSFELFAKERAHILKSLKDRAEMIVQTFNSMEGFRCNPVQGAMYAFPRFKLPPKAIEAAKAAKQPPDVFYAFQLLENTGVCVVPGSGFGQKPGTYHFRTTILPQMEPLKQMLTTFKDFHGKFTKKYS